MGTGEANSQLLLLFSLASLAVTWPAASFVACNRTYIVYMDPAQKPAAHATHADWYAAHLESSLSIDPARHLLYTYSAAAYGFAAVLHPSHVPVLRRHPAVLHLHPDSLVPVHTTRSPHFLGLSPWPPRSPRGSGSGSGVRVPGAAAGDVIVGVLDTGVWPESPSFDDTGFSAVPYRWRGACEAGVDFPSSLCNRKLVGARSFGLGYHAAAAGDKPREEFQSPRDRDGHGTHTASTAAGAPVANASLLGYASGVARGMAPGARVAAYKVCWSNGCYGSDILAGIDKAIEDGVDVISISLGGGASIYSRDPVAVGALSAVRRGIFVACSAGNSGPSRASLTNTAPWIATIGAGTLDRDFPAYVQLSNGQKYTGVSLYSGGGLGRMAIPVVYGKGVQVGSNSSKLCLPGTLDAAEVKGKIVFCDRGINARVEKGEVVKEAGGVGMILANVAVIGEELVADSHLLPTVALGARSGDVIRNYLRANSNATAILSFAGTVLDVRPSPVVAAFSSRGPNTVVPQLLKPDLIGPGVNILAGWSGSIGPTGLVKDERRSAFNIMSGTSMSCPHISGVAALLKAAHPDWSPTAIKSALMTTAYTVDNTGSLLLDAAGGSVATPWAYGSGHVDPQKALSPGLVYDITTEDYVAFLCSLDYSSNHVQAISKGSSNQTCARRLSDPGELNYPSFSVVFGRKTRRVVKYSRELTNVGTPGSVYNVQVSSPASVGVTVKPTKLVFNQVGQKLRYKVTFTSNNGGDPTDMAFGWIIWSNQQHQVRSPVSYLWQLS